MATNQQRSAAFLADFHAQTAELQITLAMLPSSSLNATTTIGVVQRSLIELRRASSEAADYLPAYDQRQVENNIKSLESAFESYRATNKPKPKFSFASRPKAATTVPKSKPTPILSPEPSTAPILSSATPSASSSSSNSMTLSSLSQTYITLSDLLSHSQSTPSSTPSSSSPSNLPASFGLDLSALSSCIINLLPSSMIRPDRPRSSLLSEAPYPISALHVRSLKRCILLLPPDLEGSVMLDGLEDCLVVLGSWQYRMHNSTSTAIYLHSTSRSSTPIIESCKDLSFGPYLFSSLSPSLTHHGAPLPPIETLHRQQQTSTYPNPQDFSHPNPSVPSPNWRHVKGELMEEVKVELLRALESLREAESVSGGRLVMPKEMESLLTSVMEYV